MNRCIVVDDDELTRMLYERRLRRAGYACEAFADPELALAVLASAAERAEADDVGEARAFALFVDHEMPRLDGIELLERLRPRLDRIARHVRLCSAAALRPDACRRLAGLGLEELGKDVLQCPDALAHWLRRHDGIHP